MFKIFEHRDIYQTQKTNTLSSLWLRRINVDIKCPEGFLYFSSGWHLRHRGSSKWFGTWIVPENGEINHLSRCVFVMVFKQIKQITCSVYFLQLKSLTDVLNNRGLHFSCSIIKKGQVPFRVHLIQAFASNMTLVGN